MKNLPNENYSTVRWIILSQLLLALYLGFFHTALNRPPTEIIFIGLGFSVLTTAIIVLCRNVFFNKFEYWIHLALGLDIFCEGFNPNHHSLHFYYCAAGFWLTFWIYHGFLLYFRKPENSTASPASPVYQEIESPAEANLQQS